MENVSTIYSSSPPSWNCDQVKLIVIWSLSINLSFLSKWEMANPNETYLLAFLRSISTNYWQIGFSMQIVNNPDSLLGIHQSMSIMSQLMMWHLYVQLKKYTPSSYTGSNMRSIVIIIIIAFLFLWKIVRKNWVQIILSASVEDSDSLTGDEDL